MKASYYAMKRRLGGEKWTVREKLCFHWYPCPGCNMHCDIVGERRGGILFKRYSGNYDRRGHKMHLIYWRTHPMEWAAIQAHGKRK